MELQGLLKHPQIMDALLNLASTLYVLSGLHGSETVERAMGAGIDELEPDERRRFLEIVEAIGHDTRQRQRITH